MPDPAVVPAPEVDEIRPFPISRLRKSINEALSAPEFNEKRVAVVATAAVEGKDAQFGLFVRIGDQWSFGGTLEKRPNKPMRKEVMVVFSK